MLLAPIGCEAGWLFAFEHISHNIRRQERETDHLLNAAFGCLLGIRNLSKRLARFCPSSYSLGQ